MIMRCDIVNNNAGTSAQGKAHFNKICGDVLVKPKLVALCQKDWALPRTKS
jgi:hypothetical protein